MTNQPRRERDRADRRELIIRTARHLAETEGWEAVTTRRLAELIEYSQPVLYSHFANKDAIVAAVAMQGFVELADALARGRAKATANTYAPEADLIGLAETYLDFAEANPALYDAMFTMAIDLPFAQADTPAPLQAGFNEIAGALAPMAGTLDPGLFAEVGWSALHGLVTLTKAGRLLPEARDQRLSLLVNLIIRAADPN